MKDKVMDILFSLLSRINFYKHKRVKSLRYNLTHKVKEYLKQENKYDKEEKQEIIKFLDRNLIKMQNYQWILRYYYKKENVHTDLDNGLKYVITKQNKRLYFKRSLSVSQIQELCSALFSEQDKRSPHCYQYEAFRHIENCVVLDIGAAEGIFGLSIIENIKDLYLYECDVEWIEALQATFAPWKEKVQIIQNLVSDSTEGDKISLDKHLKGVDRNFFIKADVEGYEMQVLKGCENLFKEGRIKELVFCTYHREEDAENIDNFVQKQGMSTSFSKGLLFINDKHTYDIKPPYAIRKGLLHGFIEQ